MSENAPNTPHQQDNPTISQERAAHLRALNEVRGNFKKVLDCKYLSSTLNNAEILRQQAAAR